MLALALRTGIKDRDSGVAVTADFLLNFTSLGEDVRVGGREVDLHTNLMPGLYFGVRF